MGYDPLSDAALISDAERMLRYLTRVAAELSKLAQLRAEGVVSSKVYEELIAEYGNKFEGLLLKADEIVLALRDRVKGLSSEESSLSRTLEVLEIRQAIGDIDPERHRVESGLVSLKLGDVRGLRQRFEELNTHVEGNIEEISRAVSKRPRG